MRSVNVYNNDVLAGVLTEVSFAEYVFRYDDAYFADNTKTGISATLPKSQQEYHSSSIFPFFTNMLPEGSNRKVMCRLHKISEDDFFGLLMAVRGADFIGAITIA